MPKRSSINQNLEKLVNSMLEEASKDGSTMDMEDKFKAMDRALKLEQLKAKISDEQFGKDFDLGGDDDG